MVRDGYHGRLVLKLPYYRTELHHEDAASGDSLRWGNRGPSTPVPGRAARDMKRPGCRSASRPSVMCRGGAPSGGGSPESGVRTSALATMPVITTSRTAGVDLPGPTGHRSVSVGGRVGVAVAPATLSSGVGVGSGSAVGVGVGVGVGVASGVRVGVASGVGVGVGLRRRGRRRRFHRLVDADDDVAERCRRPGHPGRSGSFRSCPPRPWIPQPGCRRSCWQTRRHRTSRYLVVCPSMSGSTKESTRLTPASSQLSPQKSG